MRLLSQFGAKRRKLPFLGAVAVAGFMACMAQNAFAQEDDEAMDGDQSVTISCDDGSKFNALFDDTSVEITLADGSKINLPQKDDAKGYVYTNGKFTLSGDDDNTNWIVDKKTPVPCHFDDEGQQPSHFDEPLTVDTTPLPKDKANPDAQPQINCYRFAGFMVKEVDLGEEGAESLAITAPDAACDRTAGKDEKPVKDDAAGYFFGAKSNLVFFQAQDGWNGGLPFVVYDARTMKRLFDDSLQGDDFESLDVSGTTVKMTFRRVFSSSCSLYKDSGSCADSIKKATGLGGDIKLPDCTTAYDAEKKRTPDYAKQIEDLSSVIAYDAELDYDGSAVTIKPLQGEAVCSVPT